jgi:hypothetical protein
VKLLRQFLLPLVAEIWRAKDSNTADFASGKKFAGDQQCLDSLADANVIGDEHPDGMEAEGHEKRHELVWAWANGNPAQGTEGAGAIPQGEACGIPEQFGRHSIPDILFCGKRKRCWLNRLDPAFQQREMHTADFMLISSQRPEQHELCRKGG